MHRSIPLVIGAAALAIAACCKAPPPEKTGEIPEPAGSDDLPDLAPSASASGRCAPPAPDAMYVLGEAKGTPDDDIIPYGVEVGQATGYDGGFALGALRPDGQGSSAVLLTTNDSGGDAKLVPLGAVHGDTPPPSVTARGNVIVTALLDEGAAQRRLRVAKVEGTNVTWGPTFEQGQDESTAFDLALGATRGVAVWDDEEKSPDHGVIRLATFAATTLAAPSAPRTITLPQTDAEMPRVVPRNGGFYVVYVSTRPEKTDAEHEPGEIAETRALEALMLDENGATVGLPKKLTPETGHVLTYDVAAVEGGAMIAYRDDDTPSGSSGGVVSRIVLKESGPTPPTVVSDSDVGVGVPAIFPGWIAVSDASERTRLAKLTPAGDLDGALAREPALGLSEAVAAKDDKILAIRPAGRAVRVFVTTCR